MIFADKRYGRIDKRSKLPQWIQQFLSPDRLNLTVEMAVSLAQQFLKQMAQPLKKEATIGFSLWDKSHVLQQPASKDIQPMDLI